MNATVFSELLTDISDEYIVSAAKPHIRSVHWYQVTAIAAGIVLLIAAAVYPKLRMQMPEVTEPPATAETTAAVTTAFGQMMQSVTRTSVQSVTANAQTTAAVTVTVYTTAVTTPAETEPPETDAPVNEPPQTAATTARQAETAPPETKPEIIPETLPQTKVPAQALQLTEPLKAPVWKGIAVREESESPSEPNIDCRFGICPDDANDRLCAEYGIPPEYDLTQHQCLLIDIVSGCQTAAVIAGDASPNGLTLIVAYLNQPSGLCVFRYAVPLPDHFTADPESCRVQYIGSADETEFQMMLTDSPTVNFYE